MISNTQHIYIIERKPEEKICKECHTQMEKGDIVFSKRKKHYYCVSCALRHKYLEVQPEMLILANKK